MIIMVIIRDDRVRNANMRKRLVAGNWKMHGTFSSAKSLLVEIAAHANEIHDVELAVFPPFVHLSLCQSYLSQTSIKWGAQTVSEYADGAYTGEISVTMLRDLGCHYVIVGHSERRQLFGENTEMLAKKCEMIMNSGMQPILCVGETLKEHELGKTLSVVQEQLAVAAILKDNCSKFSQLIVAYEPVWAIGTGKSASPEEAQAVHAAIRSYLSSIDAALAVTRILYGGSVKSDNAAALFAMSDIDGALVGGASLNAEQFLKIGKLCSH